MGNSTDKFEALTHPKPCSLGKRLPKLFAHVNAKLIAETKKAEH